MRIRRYPSKRVCSVVFATLLVAAAPAAAQESKQHPGGDISSAEQLQIPLRIELRPLDSQTADSPRRPRALMPLYGSFIALQGLDIHSTRRGMTSGKTGEANPLMGPIVENGTAFVAVKAAATAGAIWCAEKLWKKSPKKAVVFTVLLNATMAAVVTHNYRAAK